MQLLDSNTISNVNVIEFITFANTSSKTANEFIIMFIIIFIITFVINYI